MSDFEAWRRFRKLYFDRTLLSNRLRREDIAQWLQNRSAELLRVVEWNTHNTCLRYILLPISPRRFALHLARSLEDIGNVTKLVSSKTKLIGIVLTHDSC